MGARQSMQSEVERRPRSNSAVETGVEVHAPPARRHMPPRFSHRQRAQTGVHAHDNSDVDEEADEATPGPSSHTVHNDAGLSFSFRPMARASFLQALAGSSQMAASSAPVSSGGGSRRARDRHSVSVLHLLGQDLKCPICHKRVPSDDVEVHLVMCFTRPKIAYNEDIITEGKGECAICLDEMLSGDTIARLPCLCIYHKTCIDEWFKRKNCCPEHPGDE
jgi:E3 ubiquitin-protein ligase ZNRF1/2